MVVGGVAQAETLREALIKTYQSNPTIMAQRAQVRSLDESVAVARAQGRPQISGVAGLNQNIIRRGAAPGRSISAGVDVSYDLFNAGRVRNGIRAANERVLAGRANLRATEGDIFTETVSAYMDVIRDRSIVTLNRNQVRVLETNLQATRDRFEVGDLTRTDVAQSEARLALAQSNLATAEGRLEGSEENYRRVIGVLPDELDPPPPLPPLPGTPQQAEDIALANNSDLQSIAAQIRAAGRDVSIARADRLPTVSGVSRNDYINYLGSSATGSSSSATSSAVGVEARIPIYQGRPRRRAGPAAAGGAEPVPGARRRGRAAGRRQHPRRLRQLPGGAGGDRIEPDRGQRQHARARGHPRRADGGHPQRLDVLNAEQELLNAQVALVTARRDAYVAGFQLLNAMGRAEAEDLNLDGGALYDPVQNYDRVSRRWSDWKDDPAPQPVSTRTVTGGAISPVTPPSE
jgi:outer membrane protein